MSTASDTSSDSSEDHSLKEDVNSHDSDAVELDVGGSDQLQDAYDGHDSDFGKDIGHVNIDDRHYTNSHGSDGGRLDGHDNSKISDMDAGISNGDSDDNDGGDDDNDECDDDGWW